MNQLLSRLIKGEHLRKEEYITLLGSMDESFRLEAAVYARARSVQQFGNEIYLRGLIEISNYCRNNCNYCGIRHDNQHIERYRLSCEEILEACHAGDKLGIKTFVLQGGEDPVLNNSAAAALVKIIRSEFPNTAITLSLGEKNLIDYAQLFDAGATRYLLRHETANRNHYVYLHPHGMSYNNRLFCLYELHQLGFQTGAGMMVGSPGQTLSHLAEDLAFLQRFGPEMIGIGPFVPQKDTPFAAEKPGSTHMTLFLISLLRLLMPTALIPATTALATLKYDGYEQGILAGANVIMLNLTPQAQRSKYAIYDNKRAALQTVDDEYNELTARMQRIGYRFSSSRGDYKPKSESICTNPNHE